MRFGIVGAGPVGSILAAHLTGAGHDVYVVDTWKDHLEAIVHNGVEITGIRQMHERIAGGFEGIAELRDLQLDFLVLAVKACVLRRLLRDLSEVLGPEVVVVSLQNGLDTEEVIKHALNSHQIHRVVVNYAGNIMSPGKVVMNFFNAPNHVGCICKHSCHHADELAQVLTAAHLETRSQVDIKRYVWEKTILSAVLAPISAVTGMNMQEVMDMSDTYRIVESLLAECIQVAARSGYDFGPGFFNFCMDYLGKGGPHKPSMLVDIENGRETEIDFITGRVSFYGSLNHVPTPVNDMFTRLVKTVERRARPGHGARQC